MRRHQDSVHVPIRPRCTTTSRHKHYAHLEKWLVDFKQSTGGYCWNEKKKLVLNVSVFLQVIDCSWAEKFQNVQTGSTLSTRPTLHFRPETIFLADLRHLQEPARSSPTTEGFLRRWTPMGSLRRILPSEEIRNATKRMPSNMYINWGKECFTISKRRKPSSRPISIPESKPVLLTLKFVHLESADYFCIVKPTLKPKCLPPRNSVSYCRLLFPSRK